VLATNALSRPCRKFSAKSMRRSLGNRSDPLSENQSTKQKCFVHIDDILRSVNSRHCTLKRSPVHAFGPCNAVADSTIRAEVPARGKRAGQGTITRRFSL